MRITTWGEYGLIVGLHLAKHSSDHPLPARDLAEAEQLPPDYIEQILLKLRRAGLVESVRGAKGAVPRRAAGCRAPTSSSSSSTGASACCAPG